MPKAIDLTDQVFGRLTAIKPTNRRIGNNVVWECKCECGNVIYVPTENLTRHATRSCGCMYREDYVENTCLKNLTSHINKNNTSGVKGVTWDKSRKKWVVRIMLQGKNKTIGRYTNLKDAARARRKAEQELFDPILAAHSRPLTREQ